MLVTMQQPPQSAQRVLIVDDSVAFRQALRMLLERTAGIELVGEAEDGEQAVAQTAAVTPDVVLIDMVMPRVNGLAATRLIKAQAPGTYVVLLSIQGEESVRRAAADAGADDFAWKGNLHFELGGVLAKARRVLSGQREADGDDHDQRQ